MFVITGPKSDNVEEGFALFCIHEVIMASEKQGNIKREHGIEKDFFLEFIDRFSSAFRSIISEKNVEIFS